MRRIPSFDPGVTTNKPYIDVGAADAGSQILLYNESPFNLDLDFFNGNASILHAWEARYWVLDGETRQIGWTIDTALNVTAPPISLVMGELYSASERILGSYPMALIRQASVGNEIATTTSNSATLVNTGNPANTNVVTLNSASNANNTFTLTNDGLMQLLVTIAGALVQAIKSNETDPILQLGAAAHQVAILGDLIVDGNVFGTAGTLQLAETLINIAHALTVGGLLTVSSSGVAPPSATDMITNVPTSTNVHRLRIAGVDELTLDTTNLVLPSNAILLANNVPYKAKGTGGAANNLIGIDAANNTAIWEGPNNQILFKSNTNTDLSHMDNNGSMVFNAGTGNVFGTGLLRGIASGTASIAASSAVTISHGLGLTPTAVLMTTDQATSSGTNSAYTYTSTQATLFNGAGATLTYRWWANC